MIARRRLRWAALVLLNVLLPACSAEPEGATTQATEPLKSVVPTPRTWSGEGLTESFRIAAQIGALVSLPDPVDWFEAENRPPEQAKAARDYQWQQVLLQQNQLQVLVQMDPYKDRKGAIPGLPKSIAAPSFADPVLRKAFIADAVQRVRLYRPTYVCLGMEINAYYEQHPEDFKHFVSLFKEARAAIRKIQPDALVFVSFQYEQFLGRFGGQGGLPKHPPQWELFEQFAPDADAIGLSSYPMDSFVPPRFGDPAAIPPDYYNQIASHTDKPIVFTELGWPTAAAYGGSPDNQAKFLQRLPELTSGLELRLVNWFFLHDAVGFGPVFESMGLLNADGSRKPGFAVWERLWR